MRSNPKANELRQKQTDAENHLWKQLRNRSLFVCKFRRQFPVGPYIADFACLEAKLIVELDGGQHAEQEEYDAKRTRYLRLQGYRVLRFWNCDVFEKMDGVLIAITEVLSERGLCISPHPNPLPGGEGEKEEGEGIG